jgi:hypothetical protein
MRSVELDAVELRGATCFELRFLDVATTNGANKAARRACVDASCRDEKSPIQEAAHDRWFGKLARDFPAQEACGPFGTLTSKCKVVLHVVPRFTLLIARRQLVILGHQLVFDEIVLIGKSRVRARRRHCDGGFDLALGNLDSFACARVAPRVDRIPACCTRRGARGRAL